MPPLRGRHSFARSPACARSTGYARKLAPLVALRDARALTSFGYCRSFLALASLRSHLGLASLDQSQGLASSASLFHSRQSQAPSVRVFLLARSLAGSQARLPLVPSRSPEPLRNLLSLVPRDGSFLVRGASPSTLPCTFKFQSF